MKHLVQFNNKQPSFVFSLESYFSYDEALKELSINKFKLRKEIYDYSVKLLNFYGEQTNINNLILFSEQFENILCSSNALKKFI